MGGRIDPGIKVLIPVLREVNLTYPATLRGTLALAAWLYMRLRARGASFRERREGEIPRETLTRVDVCGGVGKGLTDVDPLRAAYFQLQYLLLALEAGEPTRIAAGLSMFGSMLMAQGTTSGLRRGGSLVAQGEAIARRLGAPYLLGSTAIQIGFHHLIQGEWTPALERFDAGLKILQESCRGIALERNLARMGSMIALDARGELREITVRATVW
jgi:hypothetical protein